MSGYGPRNLLQANLIQFPKKVNDGDIQYQGERSIFTNSLRDTYMEDMTNPKLTPVFDFTCSIVNGVNVVTLNKVVGISQLDGTTRGRVPLASFQMCGSSTGNVTDIQCTSLTCSGNVQTQTMSVSQGLSCGYLTTTLNSAGTAQGLVSCGGLVAGSGVISGGSVSVSGTIQGTSFTAILAPVGGNAAQLGGVTGGMFSCTSLSVKGVDLMTLLANNPGMTGPAGTAGQMGATGQTGAVGPAGPPGASGSSGSSMNVAPLTVQSLIVNGSDTPATSSSPLISNGYLRATRQDINHQIGCINFISDGSMYWKKAGATSHNLCDVNGNIPWSVLAGVPDLSGGSAASVTAQSAGSAAIGGVAGFFGGLLGSSYAATSADGTLMSQAITSAGSSFSSQLGSAASQLSAFNPLGQSGTAPVPSNPWLNNAAFDPFLGPLNNDLVATLPSPSQGGLPATGSNYNMNPLPNPNFPQFSENTWDSVDLGSRASSFGGQSYQSQADAGVGQAGFNVGNRYGSATSSGTGGFANSSPTVGTNTTGPGALSSASHQMFQFSKGAFGGFKRWALSAMPNTVPASGVADAAYRLAPSVTGVAATGSGVAGVFPMYGLPVSFGASI